MSSNGPESEQRMCRANMFCGLVVQNLTLISIKGLVLYVTIHLSCWLNQPFKPAKGIILNETDYDLYTL